MQRNLALHTYVCMCMCSYVRRLIFRSGAVKCTQYRTPFDYGKT